MELEIKGRHETAATSTPPAPSVPKTKTVRFYSARIAAGRPFVQHDHGQQRAAPVDRPERQQQPDERLHAGLRADVHENGGARRFDK